MSNKYQIYLISDSTGETLERIFLALKAQFKNIDYKIHSYSFTRTENQILKILESLEGPEGYLCHEIHILGVICIYHKPIYTSV